MTESYKTGWNDRIDGEFIGRYFIDNGGRMRTNFNGGYEVRDPEELARAREYVRGFDEAAAKIKSLRIA